MARRREEVFTQLLTEEADANLEVVIDDEFYVRTGLKRPGFARMTSQWAREGKVEWLNLNRLRLIVDADPTGLDTAVTKEDDQPSKPVKRQVASSGVGTKELTELCAGVLESRFGRKLSSRQLQLLEKKLAYNAIDSLLAVTGLRVPLAAVDGFLEALGQ